MLKNSFRPLSLMIVLVMGLALSACNGAAASPARDDSAIVTSAVGTVPTVSTDEPVTITSEFSPETGISRVELWVKEEAQNTATLITSGQPTGEGRVWLEWTPAGSGPVTLELRAYDRNGQLRKLVIQQAFVSETEIGAASDLDTAGIIDIDIPDRVVDSLLPRLLENIQIGDEPLVISSRAILIFLYLMGFILVIKIVSSTWLNWGREKRAIQLADIDVLLRQLDLERSRLEFLRQQQEVATRDQELAAGAPLPAGVEGSSISPTERRRLQYLRQHGQALGLIEAPEKSVFTELSGGIFFGGCIGLISSLIIGLLLVLLVIVSGEAVSSDEPIFSGLVAIGLYLGALLGLAGGLANIFSNRSFFTPALRKVFTGFTGLAGRLIAPHPSKPIGGFRRALLGGILGIFYGIIYGGLLGMIGIGLLGALSPPMNGESLAASGIIMGVAAGIAVGAVGGGIIGGVIGAFYGLLSEKFPQQYPAGLV